MRKLMLLGVIALIFSGCSKVTLESTSPDGAVWAAVRDGPGWALDRNFEILLRQKGEKRQQIFRSPDERHSAQLRFIWSSDSKALLLVGTGLFTEGPTRLVSGEELYFLYRLSDGNQWCNSRQLSQTQPFGVEQLRQLGFTDNFELAEDEASPEPRPTPDAPTPDTTASPSGRPENPAN